MKELWHPVLGYESFYQVSNLGRVWSIRANRVMKPVMADRRYQAVNLYARGKRPKMRKVHQLVAEAFIGPRPDGLLCLHRDDDKTNNTAENLYWGTPSQNNSDCNRNGRHHMLDMTMVRAIRNDNRSDQVIAKEHGLARSTVWRIRIGKSWAECI